MRAGQIDLVDLELPIILRPSAPVSDEELMRFSELNRPYKIERNTQGELIVMTPVGFTGGTHEIYVASALLHWAEQDGHGSAVGSNAGFNLPDGSCLAPDAAWVTNAQLDALTDKQKAGYPPLCPDFLIEVRSQSDARRVVEAKMQTWLDNGAQLAWLVDPIDCSVTIYRPGQTAETLLRPEVVIAGEPVAGFELRCGRLWAAR
jgi:Uma2 family endonuclease